MADVYSRAVGNSGGGSSDGNHGIFGHDGRDDLREQDHDAESNPILDKGGQGTEYFRDNNGSGLDGNQVLSDKETNPKSPKY